MERQEFRERLAKFKKIKVFKMGRFMQAIFYLLSYDKEGIVEAGTQKFFWKTARDKIDNQFLLRMRGYQVFGEKAQEFKPYQTINYVEKLIAEITPEAVEQFDMTAGRLYRWLLMALENRKADIIRRKALLQKERDERDSKIAAREKRAADREAQLEAAKQAFLEEKKDEIQEYEEYMKAQEEGVDEYGEDEDEEEAAKEKKVPVMPEFNEEQFLADWDAENPEVEVAEEQKDHVDNDWVLTEEEVAEQIKQYWGPDDA